MNVSVLYAAKKFMRLVAKQKLGSIVLKRVMLNIEEIVRLTMKLGSVLFAVNRLVSIDLAKQKRVAKNAVYVVCCCQEKTKRDVYNLTVDEVPEYFANGILVHNCMDAIAYACLSRPFSPMRAKPPKRRDGYREEMIPSAWTY